MKSSIIALLAAGAFALGLSAAPLSIAQAQVPEGYPAEYGQIVDGAKAEGTLRIYSTTDAAAAQPLVDDFEALYPGVTVEYSDVSSAELYNRVISEDAAGQPGADVVWTSGMDTGARLAADGYAAEYASPEIPGLPDWSVWDNKAYGTTFEPLVFLYNKRLLPPESVPQSHADLARLATEQADLFRGKVATYDPSRTIGLVLNVFDAEFDPAFWDNLKALGADGMKIEASSGSMMEKVGSGEYLLAWNVIGSYVPPLMARNPSVDMVLPTDYTLVLSRIAFVTESAEHPNAARLFLDYLLSHRGQELLATGAGLYAVRDDVTVDQSVSGLRAKVGDVLRPIPIGQELLDKAMDETSRVTFLRDFQAALGQ
jgi:iron(III) transport system substrate-binding protein